MPTQSTFHGEANSDGGGRYDPAATRTRTAVTTFKRGRTLEAIATTCSVFPGVELSELRQKVPYIRTLFGDDKLSELGLAVEGTPSLELVEGSDGEACLRLGQGTRQGFSKGSSENSQTFPQDAGSKNSAFAAGAAAPQALYFPCPKRRRTSARY